MGRLSLLQVSWNHRLHLLKKYVICWFLVLITSLLPALPAILSSQTLNLYGIYEPLQGSSRIINQSFQNISIIPGYSKAPSPWLRRNQKGGSLERSILQILKCYLSKAPNSSLLSHEPSLVRAFSKGKTLLVLGVNTWRTRKGTAATLSCQQTCLLGLISWPIPGSGLWIHPLERVPAFKA